MVPFSIKCDYASGVCVLVRNKCKMPSDTVSLVTTGIGVSVLAGILSGVCYVLAHGFGGRKRSLKHKAEWYCDICGTYLHSTEKILNDDLVTCSQCGVKVCTGKCAKLAQKSRWLCLNCLEPGSWFKGIMKAIQPSSQGIAGGIGADMFNQELESLRRLEKEQIREFIENVVDAMLGENLDTARNSMICNDNHYLPLPGQPPCSAHEALRQLIEKVLREAVNRPLLEKAHAISVTQLEKANLYDQAVISSYQTNPSSSANSISSSSRNNEEKEYFFGKETLDSKWKTTDFDTSSVSSLEEWLQCDGSLGSKKTVDKVSLMIQQDIEEAEYDSEDDCDDAEYFRSGSSLISESESNWFLQRRHFQGTPSPVPVPMLVPNPATDAKVLIGDKPLDDTSDLSDIGSDFEGPVQPQTTQTLLVHSKHVIGGGSSTKELFDAAEVRSESSTDSGVKEVNGKEQKNFDLQDDNLKTDISLDDDNVEDSSYISAYSNTEKEAEYTERYASLPRQILKTSTPVKSYKEVKVEKANSDYDGNGIVHADSDFEFIGGTYSRKEREKWKNAVEMENNPYSKENIERRIQSSNSATGAIFGSDYYAKLASRPSGAGKQNSAEINGVSWPPQELPQSPRSPIETPLPDSSPVESIVQRELLKEVPSPKYPFQADIIASAVVQEASNEDNSVVPELPKLGPHPINLTQSFLDNPPEPPKSRPPTLEFFQTDGIHQALKAIVTPIEDDIMPNEIFKHSRGEKPAMYIDENYGVQATVAEVITSDSDLSCTNFYDVEHSQVVRKAKNDDVLIPIKATPLGLSYKHLEDNNANNITMKNLTKNTPLPKPRVLVVQSKTEGKFIRATSKVSQQNISSVEKTTQGRKLSESSLIEDTFDAPPKVISPKKDNTLIDKIYKDPKVRLFAMNSRDDSVGSDMELVGPKTYYSQNSIESKLTYSERPATYISRGKSGYSSDDGMLSENGFTRKDITGQAAYFNLITSANSSDDGILSEYESGKTGKMSFFSSEEDLLSINSEPYTDLVSTKNKDVKLYLDQVKSRTPSPGALITPRTPSTRKFIYGSQEDLLTIDETVSSIPQRKDNTIVSKIYKDPNVRSFALKTSHRDMVPVETEQRSPTYQKQRLISSSDEEHYHVEHKPVITQHNIYNKHIYRSYDDLSSTDISLNIDQSSVNTNTDDKSEISVSSNSAKDYNFEDLDVGEIRKKFLVKSTLGKFSQSEVNIKDAFHRSSSMEIGNNLRVSVRDLRKKFENNEVHNKPVISSLTARSLSKQVKEILKQ